MAFSQTRMAKADRRRAGVVPRRDDLSGTATVGHSALEQRDADRLTRQRAALNARPLVTAQLRAVHDLGDARSQAAVIQLSSKDEKQAGLSGKKRGKGKEKASTGAGAGDTDGDDADGANTGDETASPSTSTEGDAEEEGPSAADLRKIYLRDRLRRAKQRAAARAGRTVRHRPDETSELEMVGRVKSNAARPPHMVDNPWGRAYLGQGGYDTKEQPNVRLDPATHPGMGGRKTSTKYSSMSPALDRSPHIAALLAQMKAFQEGIAAPAKSDLKLNKKVTANASLMAVILAAESHKERLGDGGKYVRAGLRRAQKQGKFLPSFNTARGKSGMITAEQGGQQAFRNMMADPVKHMQQHHVDTLEEMSSSSEDEGEADGGGTASAPSSASASSSASATSSASASGSASGKPRRGGGSGSVGSAAARRKRKRSAPPPVAARPDDTGEGQDGEEEVVATVPTADAARSSSDAGDGDDSGKPSPAKRSRKKKNGKKKAAGGTASSSSATATAPANASAADADDEEEEEDDGGASAAASSASSSEKANKAASKGGGKRDARKKKGR